MKVSVVTLHAVSNYGSLLQTYATQKVLEQIGCQAEIVDYRRKPVLPKTVKQILTDPEYDPVMKLKLILIKPSGNKAKRVKDSFLNRYVHLTKQLYTADEDFLKYPIEADVYCTGSDQVWNTGWHGEIPAPFFLGFVPDDKKKIAFSASIGKEELEEWEKPGIREYLKRYAAISVREKSAVGIIRSLDAQLNAVQVLDPTLAADPEIWQKLASPERVVKEKYVLIYQLSGHEYLGKYAQELAKKKHLKLIRICTRYDSLLSIGHGIVLPRVEDFLALFRDAEYIVTNSFHGTAFSLIFHKQLVDIYPKLYSTRLASILELTGLQARHLTDYSDFSLPDQPIDYDTVDGILAQEREKTRAFLQEVIYG